MNGNELIVDLEKQFNFKLPDDYKIYICDVKKGGRLDELKDKKIEIKDTEESIWIDELYLPEKNASEDNLLSINEKYKETICGRGFIFGKCLEGGYLVFYKQYDTYNVCYWDENHEFELSAYGASVYYLADSFDGLLKLIEKNNYKGENDMSKVDYLPLGSIVLLKGDIQKLVIISRGLIVNNNERELFFDYAATCYPKGLDSEKVVYFNADDIAKVVFEGYKDDDDTIIVNNINEYISKHPELVRGNSNNWK